MTAELLRYRSPRSSGERWARRGLALYAGVWVVTLLGLSFAAAQHGELSSLRGIFPVPVALLSSLVVLASSGVVHWGRGRIARGQALELTASLILALLLGLFFLALQAILWRRVALQGIGHGPLSTLAVAYAIHALMGLLSLAVLLVRAFDGRFSAAHHLPIDLWSWDWHLGGAAWIVFWVALVLL